MKNLQKKVKLGIVICSILFSMSGCGGENKSDDTSTEKFDTITCVENLACDIPQSYRSQAISKTLYDEQKAKIESTFETGVVETKSMDVYQLTDYSSFLFNFYSGESTGLDILSINNAATIQELLVDENSLPEVNVIGNLQRAESEGVEKLSADIQFSVVFEEGVAGTVFLQGKFILIQYNGIQYMGIFGVQPENYDEMLMNHIADSFNFTGEESSIFTEDERTSISFVGETESEQITIDFSSMWELNDDQDMWCDAFGANLSVVIMDSGVDRELSDSDIYNAFSPESSYSNVTLVWSDSLEQDNGQKWIGKVNYIESDEGNYYNMFFSTAKGRSVIFYEVIFPEGEDIHMVTKLVKDVCSHTTINKSLDVNGTVKKTTEKKKKKDKTTEQKTERKSTTEKKQEKKTSEPEERTPSVNNNGSNNNTNNNVNVQSETPIQATPDDTTPTPDFTPETPKQDNSDPVFTPEEPKNNDDGGDLDVEW